MTSEGNRAFGSGSRAPPTADFKTLFEAAPGLHLALNNDLTIIAASDAYLRVTATERQALVGRALFEVFPGDDPFGVALRASLEKVRASGTPEIMAPVKRFEERWWSPVNSPVHSAGAVVGLIHRLEDVTELVRARQELVGFDQRLLAVERNRELEPSVLRAPAVPRYLRRPTGRESASTATLPLVLVADPDPEVGEQLRDLLSDIAEVQVVREGEAALELATQRAPALVLADLSLPRLDGYQLCRQLKSTPVTARVPVVLLTPMTQREALPRGWEVGADEYLFKPFYGAEVVTRVRTLLRSVAMRQLSEAALHTERERAEITLTSIADGVITTDEEGRVELLNPTAEALTGWSSREARHHRLDEVFRIIHRGSHAPLEDLVRRALGQGSIVGQDSELVLLRRDGSERDVADSAAPIRAHDGSITGLVLVFHDVGREHYLAEQLRQAQKMEAIGHLTGGVAHDFNNLLGVVLANAELLSAALPGEQHDVREPLVDLIAAATRGRELVRQLLGFSRQELLTVRRLDPATLLKTFVSTLRRVLPESIELTLRIEDGVPTIMADRAAIEHILLNPTTNARDAMPDGGRLDVQLRVGQAIEPDARPGHTWEQAPGPCVQIVVADDGGGMADEALRRIFEPFFTTKEPGRGTGLGMAMAYGLMKQQGGWLNVNSAPGAGTTVRLHFPIPAPEPLLNEVDTPPPRSVPEPGARVRTILLVEDDAPLRRASTAVLKTLGYRVLVAADGEEALELYRVHCANLSLIVTDVVMPRLGGWELIRQIRHQDRDIPFLVVSGYAGGAGAAAELNDPRVTFLEKPWTMAELAAGAQRCLEAVPVQA